jgi:hypothetical protein
MEVAKSSERSVITGQEDFIFKDTNTDTHSCESIKSHDWQHVCYVCHSATTCSGMNEQLCLCKKQVGYGTLLNAVFDQMSIFRRSLYTTAAVSIVSRRTNQ